MQGNEERRADGGTRQERKQGLADKADEAANGPQEMFGGR